jgi:hypothetical protein
MNLGYGFEVFTTVLSLMARAQCYKTIEQHILDTMETMEGKNGFKLPQISN